ncbi:MAG: putative integral membrane protein [Sphingobacteriales bacterium]|jgi:uncharacterized integral membrane protein
MSIKNIFLIILAIVLTILVMQNTGSVVFKMFVTEIVIPKIILIPVLVLIGFIAGMLVSIKPSKKVKKEEKSSNYTSAEKQSE